MKKVWISVVLSGIAMLCMVAQVQATDAKELYKIESKATTLKKGQAGQAGFNIVLLKKDTKVHPQAPFQCSVSASEGLQLSKDKLGHDDKKISKDQKKVAVQVGVTAQHKGAKSVTMDCSFFVCTKDICVRTTEVVKVATNVK